MFKVFVGVSLISAIILYIVMQSHEKNDAQISEKFIEMKMETNIISRDIELQLVGMSDTEVEARLHRVFASEHIKKNVAIEDERKLVEERKKRLEKKSAENLEILEKQLEASYGGSDSDFEEVEFADTDFKDF